MRAWMRRDTALAVLSIIATFIATFLGVYLASAAQKNAETQKSLEAYRSMLRVMAVDCQELLRLNRDLTPTDRLAQLRSPVFLFSTPLQNSLLFEHMPQHRLTELIHSLTRSAYFAQKYQEHVSLHPSGILPPLAPPRPEETPQQFQERARVEADAFRERRLADAKQFHRDYVTETQRLCSLLGQKS